MEYILKLCFVHHIYVSSCEAKTGTRETKTGNKDDTSINTETSMPTFDSVSKVVVGTSNFSEIRHSRTFVDKTLWVKDFWETYERNLYITAPPKFGKSFAMNTAMEFFNAIEDINHMQGKPNGFSVRDSFKGTKLYEEARGFFDAHYHRYIVMYFDFRLLATVTDYDSFEKIFCSILCDMKKLVNPEPNRTKAILDDHKCRSDCQKDFHGAIFSLSEAFSQRLHFTYGKPVIVFIDEFDAVVYALLNNENFLPQKIFNLLFSYLSPLIKDNKFVERCYATGSLSGVMFQFAPTMEHTKFDSSELYAKHFGLTAGEVQRLLGNFSLSHLLPQVREFYGGYQVRDSDLIVYNTISVLECLKSGGKLDYYWMKAVQPITNYPELFSRPLVGKKIATVIIGDSVFLGFNALDRTTTFKLQELKKNLLDERNEACIFIKYLEEVGYLTRSRDDWFELSATNEETRFALECAWISHAFYFEKQRKISSEHRINVVNAVTPLSGIGKLSAVDAEKAMLRLAKALHEMFSQDCASVTDERVTFVGPIYFALRSKMLVKPIVFTLVSTAQRVNSTGLNSKTPENGKVDMTILFLDGGASMWKCEWGKTATVALDQLFDQKFPVIFDQFAGKVTKPKSFLGINIDRKCRVAIKYTIGSTDSKDAKEVTYPEEERGKKKNITEE